MHRILVHYVSATFSMERERVCGGYGFAAEAGTPMVDMVFGILTLFPTIGANLLPCRIWYIKESAGIFMSAKTKIVVLHMKELIYTGIFVALGILFIVLLIIMFFPDKEEGMSSTGDATTEDTGTPEVSYIPGVYTTSLVLSDHTIDVEVAVDKDSINSIRLVNLDEAVTTMYPLIEPVFDSLTQQIYEKQSLEEITYENENKYTALVLLNAIQNSLNKAHESSSVIIDDTANIEEGTLP